MPPLNNSLRINYATSQQWWDSIKNDEVKLVDWLKKQYHGEVTAADRIERFSEKHGVTNRLLRVIAKQERTHAKWVGELLSTRGVQPQVLNKEERYWNETLTEEVDTLEKGAAVAALAEKMRLERIRTIVNDNATQADIRAVFAMILPQEEFHERAFTKLSTNDALQQAQEAHERGLEELGLIMVQEIL